jgi:hypothetical protein
VSAGTAGSAGGDTADGRSVRRSTNLITNAEVEAAGSELTTAYDLVSRLRPSMMRYRNQGAEPAAYVDDVLGFTNLTTGTGDTARLVSLTVNALVELTVTANNPAWGTVSPTNGTYIAGSSLELLASPAAYFRFSNWSGDGSGTENPLSLLLDTNKSVLAEFGEILTTNHPTPHWWLAAHGYTNDLETAVASLGVNGVPLWQSYIAGLDPNDPTSQFRLAGHLTSDGMGYVLEWNPVTNRVYTIWVNTNLSDGFSPMPGASNLPRTLRSFTNSSNPSSPQFYRIEVRKP